jgi:hypothetical protein
LSDFLSTILWIGLHIFPFFHSQKYQKHPQEPVKTISLQRLSVSHLYNKIHTFTNVFVNLIISLFWVLYLLYNEVCLASRARYTIFRISRFKNPAALVRTRSLESDYTLGVIKHLLTQIEKRSS